MLDVAFAVVSAYSNDKAEGTMQSPARARLVALATVFLAVSWVGSARGALISTFTLDGNVGAEVAAFPRSSSAGAGILSLSNIPGGATINQAYLYANDYAGAVSASATFAGSALGATAVYATDASFRSFRWDVTSLITGNGAYAASYTGPTNTYGLALAVVFSHASLPSGRVIINDGAIDTGPGTSFSTSFSALAGPGNLWIHTLADNNGFGESAGEQILFNGAVIGGPVDANLGSFASLFSIPVAVLAGANVAGLAIPADTFGWDLAVLRVSGSNGRVPEPGTLVLLALALVGLGTMRKRG